MSQTPDTWTAMATNCTHVSQHFDAFLVACGPCIASAIREAVEEEREACAKVDARDAEIARLREALREAAAVMRGFVDKCDRGEARSVRTYAACKVALAKIESALAEGAKS